LAKWLSYYLYFFFFSFLFFSYWTYNYKVECGKVSCDFVIMSQWSWMVMSQVTITVCHMTRGPWESKHIATVVKCISSRELSKNSIEFSLSNSEQRDSWLNSSYQTLDADNKRRVEIDGKRKKKEILKQILLKMIWMSVMIKTLCFWPRIQLLHSLYSQMIGF